MARGVVLLSMLAGCVPPSTLGLLTDGVGPPAGQQESSMLFGVGTFLGAEVDHAPIYGGALVHELAVSDRSSFALAVGYVHQGIWAEHIEFRYRLTPEREAPFQAALLFGIGFYTYHPSGADAGVVLSGRVAEGFRIYAGGRLQPGFPVEGTAALFYVSTAGGFSYAPDPSVSLAAEVSTSTGIGDGGSLSGVLGTFQVSLCWPRCAEAARKPRH